MLKFMIESHPEKNTVSVTVGSNYYEASDEMVYQVSSWKWETIYERMRNVMEDDERAYEWFNGLPRYALFIIIAEWEG